MSTRLKHTIGASLLLVVIALIARAVPPSGSVFPGALDDFQAVVHRDRLTTQDFNRLLDAVNKLQQSVLFGSIAETACATFTINPAQRKTVNISLAQTTLGTEPVFGTVRDDNTPSRVVFDGAGALSGAVAQAWVFNHDAVQGRSGTVCVQIVRGVN